MIMIFLKKATIFSLYMICIELNYGIKEVSKENIHL